jgi:hypothetical protein
MTKNAVVVEADGDFAVLDIAGNELKTLQGLVGGWVQAIDLKSNLTLWVNEEGKLDRLPVNGFATEMWDSVFGATDVIVGTAVFTGGTDDEGDTIGLSDSQIEALRQVWLG